MVLYLEIAGDVQGRNPFFILKFLHFIENKPDPS